MLKEYPYWGDLGDAVEKYRETGSLNAVEIALYKGQIAFAEKISHLYPLSITPILGYTIRKTVRGQQHPHDRPRQGDAAE